jgi:tetratricopeptide (TPR) repeat protein
LFDLGDGFLTLKQPRLGLEHHLAALDIRLATLGQEHPHTAASCTAVGHCHQALGQFESAQQSFFQALMIRMTTNGEDHPLVADAYMAVAGCYQAQLQATMATSNYTRALTILDVDPGPQSLAAANCRFQLGQCQAQAGQYAEGLKHLRAALEVRQHGGELDQVLAAHCMALASCYAGLEQPSNALVQYQEAEEYVKATQPLSPALLAQTQCGQALSMTQMNQHMPALTLLDDVQDAVQAEGAAPELMGRIDFVRGCCYHGLSRLQQARASLTNAVSLQVHAFGADHLDIALTLVECGRVYLALEQASQAADCFRRALIIQQAQLGRDHPTTIKTQRLAQLPHATLASASTVAPSP